MEKFIISQIKSVLLKSLKNFENEGKGKTSYLIYPKDVSGEAGVYLLCSNKQERELKWGDLISKFDRVLFSGFGFNVETDLGKWISKFIVFSSKDNEVGIERAFYIITYMVNDRKKEELRAFMYVDGKQYKEITIDYILETE